MPDHGKNRGRMRLAQYLGVLSRPGHRSGVAIEGQKGREAGESRLPRVGKVGAAPSSTPWMCRATPNACGEWNAGERAVCRSCGAARPAGEIGPPPPAA